MSSGSGGMGLPNAIANRGASSYFNKGAMGNKPPSNGALPSLGSGGISANNPSQKGQIGTYGSFNKNSAIGGSRAPPGLAAMGGYKYGGISGGIGSSGIGATGAAAVFGSNYGAPRDPYIENSQGAQGSIGSSGSGMNKKSAHG